jgi:hypothetical protein
LWYQAKSWTEEEKVKGKRKYQDKETHERKYRQQLQVKEKYLSPERLKNQKDNEPKEPVMPDKEEATLPFVMKEYETELKQYYFKKERYEEHKAKIFVIVKGQRTLNMKNNLESLQGYDLIEANDDVIKLLNGLKVLTFKTYEVQYGNWTIC